MGRVVLRTSRRCDPRDGTTGAGELRLGGAVVRLQPRRRPDREVVAAPFDSVDFNVHRFAGTLDGGRVAVHEVGRDVVLAVPTLDAPGDIETLALPGPSLSVWFERGEPTVRVDADRVLTVDDTVVPGEYIWARR